jgi:hypothetical protein
LSWPTPFFIRFNSELEGTIFESSSMDIDLAQSLMGGLLDPLDRTLELFFSTEDLDWDIWNDSKVREFENLILEDFEYDGFSVEFERISELGSECSAMFHWNLKIAYTLL